MMSLGVASIFGPRQWRSNSNSSRCAATAAMTDFAAALPACSVEAARMQRTITPEYMCQGCDCSRILIGDTVFPRLRQQVVEFAESPDGKRAGRFQEHLEHARPVAPDQRISTPRSLIHAVSPVCPIAAASRCKTPGSTFAIGTCTEAA